jgi:hypothetical protein
VAARHDERLRSAQPSRYLAKYASKGTEGESLPKGVRVSGCGGLDESSKRELRWWLLPRYVREHFPQGEGEAFPRVERARGGGWVERDTGEYMEATRQW